MWQVCGASEQFPDMEFTAWIGKQGCEMVQPARRFEKRDVAMISNDPVIVVA
jgi:hypothetical protein